MKVKMLLCWIVLLIILACIAALSVQAKPLPPPLLPAESEAVITSPQADNPDPPASPVKLIFIHHSTGGNWLADSDMQDPGGDLGLELMDNNYFVSATNYGWGPDGIGDNTDIGHWWTWFRGPSSITYTTALYNEFGQSNGGSYPDFGNWTRMTDPDPSRENEIVMFKSCFPNSSLGGDPAQTPPPIGSNPLRGEWAEGNPNHTVANAKGIYIDLLEYFRTRQDKLFVVITAPPRMQSETNSTHAANARAFNNWLVNDWLASNNYTYTNVAVFDYYNVLTSNGWVTRTDTITTTEEPNDLGWPDGNHHRWWNGEVTHTQTVDNNFSAYPSGDSHPTTAGHQKATGEFVQLLNVYYNRWKGGAPPPAPKLTLTSPNGGEVWTVGSQQQIQWTTSGSVSQVDLSYSTDGFNTSHPIASSITNTGSYTWTVPDDPSTSVRVRVASTVSPTTVYDDSNADFTIQEAGVDSLTLTSPNGGEVWTVGSQRQIQWTTSGSVSQVDLSYSTDGFNTSHSIASSITNNGSYNWTVPNDPSTSVRVRVASTVSPTTVYDDSDGNFTIQGPTGRQMLTFQDGISPTAGYSGTTDVILARDAYTNANLGGLENLEVFHGEGEDETDEFRRSLMRWDISALPSEATVSAASLELYRYDGYAPDAMQITLHRVTSEWSEGSGHELYPGPGYVPDGATWLTATAGVAWTNPGGDYNAGSVGQTTLPANMSDGWVRLDATAAVRAWARNSAPNYGLLLRPLSSHGYHYFYSRSCYTATLRPRLVVTYTIGGPDYWIYLPIVVRSYPSTVTYFQAFPEQRIHQRPQ